jgi:hypothetical protein
MKAVLALSGMLLLIGNSHGEETEAQQYGRMRIEYASPPPPALTATPS